MPYREELEAALARTAAAEDELAAARSENAHDRDHIAVLEKELAEARRAEASAKVENKPATDKIVERHHKPTRSWIKPNAWVLVPVVIVGVVVTDLIDKAVKKKKQIASTQVTASVPARVEVMAELARAKADARKLIADAALVKIETQGIVDSSGYADVTKGFITFDFYAPSKQHYIHVSTSGGQRHTNDFVSGAGMRIHDPPHCSVQDVWAEAIRRGASQKSLASIRLSMTNEDTTWSFDATSPDEKPFTMTLPDECPLH